MMLTSFQMESPLHLDHAIIVSPRHITFIEIDYMPFILLQLKLTLFLGNAVISFLASFVASVMLEAPTIRLLKIIMNK
jgi:ABC-type transport system involved in cytochrome c biogenesis permease component